MKKIVLENVKNFPAKTKLWKVFGVTDELPNIADYKPYIEYPLFDAKGENRGGNGIVFDWDILTKLEKHSFVHGWEGCRLGIFKKHLSTSLPFWI